MSGDLVKDEKRIQEGFQYCRDFMGGSWARASIKDFEMTHITGGLSNTLFRCTLKDHFPTVGDEPRNVLLRLYGDIIKERSETVLNDSVVFTLLAERNMGPKLYGVFTNGRIEEYVPARVLRTDELQDPTISRACARVMARFHGLQMPMLKRPVWLFETIDRYLGVIDVLRDPNSESHSKLENSLECNLRDEYEKLKELLNGIHSPVVFCHNDFQEGNILYMADGGCGEGSSSDPHVDIVRPIDFEYSSYNYRGFDIGNHFCEWCYNYNVATPPHFSADLDDYPSREQQLNFIREYLRESGLSADEESGLLVEANAFALASHFMWCLWSIVQSKKSQIVFGYLDYGIKRLEAYRKQMKNVLEMVKEHEARRGLRQASR